MKTRANISSICYPINHLLNKLILLVCIYCTIGPMAFSQVFDNSYPDNHNGTILQAKGNAIIEDECSIVTVNSISYTPGLHDFQITFIDAGGSVSNSYAFGNPTGDEVAHGTCKSTQVDDHYLICGRSANNQMLVMKVDLIGTLIWAKEIDFGASSFSEAINIFPINNPNGLGYVVVGNYSLGTSTQLATAKLSENGTLIWSHVYTVFGGGFPGEAEMTDAALMNAPSQTSIAITGYFFPFFPSPDMVFVMSISSQTGVPSGIGGMYRDIGFENRNPQITFLKPYTSANAYDVVVSMSYGGTVQLGLTTFRVDLQNVFSTPLANHYEHGPTPFPLTNSDLICLENGQYALLGSENLGAGQRSPFVMTLSPIDEWLATFSYNEGANQSAGALVESCGIGPAIGVFNGVNRGLSNDHLLVVKDGVNRNACRRRTSWVQSSSSLINSWMAPQASTLGTIQSYPVSTSSPYPIPINCSDPDFNLRQSESTSFDLPEKAWFYPNPATDNITLNLGDISETIRMYNSSGKLVYQARHANLTSIQISHLPDGIYLLERGEGSENKSEKVMITSSLR